jgi:hypothetical protein
MDFIQTRPGIYVKIEKDGQGTQDGFNAFLEGFFYKYTDLSDTFVNKIYTRKDIHTNIWYQLAEEIKKYDSSFDPDKDFIIVKTEDNNLKKILKTK